MLRRNTFGFPSGRQLLFLFGSGGLSEFLEGGNTPAAETFSPQPQQGEVPSELAAGAGSTEAGEIITVTEHCFRT